VVVVKIVVKLKILLKQIVLLVLFHREVMDDIMVVVEEMKAYGLQLELPVSLQIA
jgi:hypothetical protein